ncbi:hypothetical protein PF010_g33256, partial [Phytophthora fragariae]
MARATRAARAALAKDQLRFLVTSACPSDSLGSVAETILRELAEERGVDEDTEGDAGDDNEGSEALQRYEQRSAEPGANAGTGVARAP